MNTLPKGYGESSLTGDRYRYGISDMRTGNTTHNVYGDSNTNVGNVSNCNNNTINVGVNEESLRIQAWLSPLEPNRRHQDVSSRRIDPIGDWVLRRDEFETWFNGQDGSVNPTLLCYGIQGVGKTYISSLVIDTLCERARGQNITVLALYCDYQAQKEQTAVNMIGGLLRQVAAQAPEIPGEIRSDFEELGLRGGKSLRLADMMKLFVKTVSSMERVYICFDAVDELLPQNRSEFLRAARQVTQDAPNTRLFLTGRPYIRKELDKHFTKEAYIIHIVADQGDITRFISRKLDYDDDRDSDLMTESLKNDIVKTLLDRSSEMFLLVALNVDAILGETSLAKRKEMLQKVATTGVDLDDVYAQTLQRIREQKGDRSRLGMEVLMWVSHSERPLSIDELCHALAVDMEKVDLDPDDVRPKDTVLGSCLGLAMVDKETSTVRPIHYTLQEYLSRPGILADAHKTLAETCLAYLNYERVKTLPANKVSNLGDMHFLQYSSLYWGIHAKVELSARAKSLALELLGGFDHHISATLLHNQLRCYHNCSLPDHNFPGLHGASYLGIVEVVVALIEMKGCDINQRDCGGLTPLMWAAWHGNEQVVRLLLSQDDVKPDKPDNNGRTPLWWASGNEHEGVVGLLLERGDVSHDKPDNYGQTPLLCASRNGNEGVVRLLLMQDDVDADRPDENGRTPLWWASFYGHEGVVGLLRTRDDVNPDKPDKSGRTPLSWATCGGYEGVARLPLPLDDINPDKPDEYGLSPLPIASHREGTEIVALLQHRASTISSPG